MLNIKKFILRTIFKCCKVSSRILFDVKKELPERILFISNNVSYLDSLLMYAFLPGNPILALNGYILRKPWIKWCLKFFGAEFIEFNPIEPSSLKEVINLLEEGRNVFLFPEGRMTKSGSLMKIYEAPGIIADKAKAYIVSVWIDGLQYSNFSILKGKMPLRPFPRTEITISKPIEFKLDDEYRKQRDYLSNRILRIMLELSFLTQYKEGESIFNLLIKASKIHGKKNFFVRKKVVEDSKRKTQSYKDIILKSFILGNYFKKHFKKQENVGVILPSSTACLCTFFGLTAYERVPAMINFSTGLANAISMCKTASLNSVITSKEFIEIAKLEEITEGLKAVGIKIYYLEDIAETFSILDKLKALFQYKRKRAPFKNSGKQKCVILFTSGSEGTPKGVVLSHNNIIANITQCSCMIDINNTDMIFNVLPMFHSFGITAGTLLPLLVGGRIFLYPSPLHYRIIPELIYETGATIMFATDTFFRGYSKVAHSYDFNSLRFILGGAEAVKSDNRNVWAERFGVRLLEGYGTTECSPAISVNNLVFCKFGTVGQILPGIEYRIKKIEGIEDGGILLVRGPNVMEGYYFASEPGVLKPVENDGWYETGDIADIDSAGFLILRDRVKRFAKIGGEMISLTAVENMVEKAYEWMKTEFEYGAIAIPHESKGEQIVLATNNNIVKFETLQQYARNNGISELFLPRNIIYKENFPLFATGKRNYVQLKKEILYDLGIEPIDKVDKK